LYGAALKEISCLGLQKTECYLNNSCENSHLPFRQKERSMQKFKSRVTLQIFTSTHAQIYNYFNYQRHLQKRKVFKQQRSNSLSEWRGLCAVCKVWRLCWLQIISVSLTTPECVLLYPRRPQFGKSRSQEQSIPLGVVISSTAQSCAPWLCASNSQAA